MDYVRQSLTQDEKVIHFAQFHWMYFLNAVFNIVFGFAMSMLVIVLAVQFQPMMFPDSGITEAQSWLGKVHEIHAGVKIVAFFVLLMGVLRFAQMMIIKATTEIAITNRRLIFKRGLIARYVGEMSIDRVEGVNVLQGILGRLLGYGRIMVRGMGVGEVVLPPIANPVRFRKAIEKAKIENTKMDHKARSAV